MNIIIIGSGIAGATCAIKIREINKEANIKIISEEPFVYNRIRLIDFITEKMNYSDLVIYDKNYFSNLNIESYFGQKVLNIDENNKKVFTLDAEFYYDKLILATGSMLIKSI